MENLKSSFEIGSVLEIKVNGDSEVSIKTFKIRGGEEPSCEIHTEDKNALPIELMKFFGYTEKEMTYGRKEDLAEFIEIARKDYKQTFFVSKLIGRAGKKFTPKCYFYLNKQDISNKNKVGDIDNLQKVIDERDSERSMLY